MAPYATAPVVRAVNGDASLIKQLLDVGAQTLMIPMVETAEQAQALVRAMRYPPHGIRGVGGGLTRATRWDGVANYLQTAHEELCLIVQVESRLGVGKRRSHCRRGRRGRGVYRPRRPLHRPRPRR